MSEASQTKACPFCAEQINIDAKKCKHCGSLLDKKLVAKESKAKEGLFLRTLNFGCGTILVVVSILVILMVLAFNMSR